MKTLSRAVRFVLPTLFLAHGSAAAQTTALVCKKRTRQVYSAFYRTEILSAADGKGAKRDGYVCE